jgi:hypothetical protein
MKKQHTRIDNLTLYLANRKIYIDKNYHRHGFLTYLTV